MNSSGRAGSGSPAWRRWAALACALLCVLAPRSRAQADAAWTALDTLVVAGPDGVAGEPAGIAVDAAGNLWVSDAARHRVLRWDARGAFAGESGSLGSDANQFRRPGALARLGSLGVAVLDRENRRVVAFDREGRRTDLVVDLASAELEAQVGRVRAVGIAADRGGALFVADADADRVLVFDFAGRFLRVLGGYGTRPGAFRGLCAVATTPHGELVTVERAAPARRGKRAAADSVAVPRARVQRLSAAGAPLAHWEFATQEDEDFAVAVDDSGGVAVSGARGGTCRVFAADGTSTGSLAPSLGPVALVFRADGTLLVAEARGGRVRRFAPPSSAPRE